MPGETAVETPPQAPQEAVTEEKKEIVEAEAKEAEAGEKQDEGKEKTEDKAAAAKAKKEPKAKKEKVPPPPQVHKKDFEKDTVYVFQFNRTPKIPSISPNCLKLETWLKLQGVKYEVSLSYYKTYPVNPWETAKNYIISRCLADPFSHCAEHE